MTPALPVTRSDAHTLYALAPLARHQPPTKRAAHLAVKAEELAARIVAVTPELVSDQVTSSAGGEP